MTSDKLPAVASNALFGVWMPIETAPKVNGSIIVFCPANLCSYLVSWDSYKNAWMIFGGFDNELLYEPSAWMPRPPHPPNPSRQTSAARKDG